jgi:hypothetical protein
MSFQERDTEAFAPKLAPTDSTYTAGQSLPFQRWFKFKEAFSPQLVYGVLALFWIASPDPALQPCLAN